MERLKRLAWRVQRVVAKPTASGVFFLRGHPRSGTNWVGALLNLHPKICCVGEFHLDGIREVVRRLQAQTWHIVGRPRVKAIVDGCMAEMVRRSLEAAADKPGATVLGDRTPHPLPWDGPAMVPGAPNILVVRDGRDVLVSWRFHLLRQPPDVIRLAVPAEFHERFNADASLLREDPAHFRKHPDALLSDEGWVRYAAGRWSWWVMRDADTVRRVGAGQAPLSVRVTRYETLHTDVEGERNRMYAFLGLEPSDAAPVSPDSRTAAGFGREDNGSFYRHGEVGDWKTYATDDAKRWIRETAGPALVELGYEKDTNWS